jgi:hypothetical protein
MLGFASAAERGHFVVKAFFRRLFGSLLERSACGGWVLEMLTSGGP